MTGWKCGKSGHFKRDCRVGKNNNGASTSNSGQGSKDHDPKPHQGKFSDFGSNSSNNFVSLFSDAYYVQNDDVAWWIDLGATSHVCKDRRWFKTYEPVEDGSVLHMGNESIAPVLGRGSVLLEFSSRKTITLINVLFVPKI